MYLQFVTIPKISEAGNFVYTQGDDFEVGHFLENGQVFELISPKIEVLNTFQIVGLGLGNDQIVSKFFADVLVAH
jgi:hypothetical protein